MQATVDTRERAQDAVDDLAGTVDQVVKGAEKSITRSGRSVRAAVEERLPATQDDLKAIHAELRRIAKRLDALEASGRPAKAGAGAASGPRPSPRRPRAGPRPRRPSPSAD